MVSFLRKKTKKLSGLKLSKQGVKNASSRNSVSGFALANNMNWPFWINGTSKLKRGRGKLYKEIWNLVHRWSYLKTANNVILRKTQSALNSDREIRFIGFYALRQFFSPMYIRYAFCYKFRASILVCQIYQQLYQHSTLFYNRAWLILGRLGFQKSRKALPLHHWYAKNRVFRRSIQIDIKFLLSTKKKHFRRGKFIIRRERVVVFPRAKMQERSRARIADSRCGHVFLPYK